jgi:hypothetical protein
LADLCLAMGGGVGHVGPVNGFRVALRAQFPPSFGDRFP